MRLSHTATLPTSHTRNTLYSYTSHFVLNAYKTVYFPQPTTEGCSHTATLSASHIGYYSVQLYFPPLTEHTARHLIHRRLYSTTGIHFSSPTKETVIQLDFYLPHRRLYRGLPTCNTWDGTYHTGTHTTSHTGNCVIQLDFYLLHIRLFRTATLPNDHLEIASSSYTSHLPHKGLYHT